MNKYITLYVPSSYTSVRADAKIAMAHIAGGVTHTRANGTWLNDTGELVHDDIDLLKSFVSDENFDELKMIVRYYANHLLANGEQSVAIETHDGLEFVTNDQPKPCPECGILIEQYKTHCSDHEGLS